MEAGQRSGALCRTKRDYENCSVGQEAGVDKCSLVTRIQCWYLTNKLQTTDTFIF